MWVSMSLRIPAGAFLTAGFHISPSAALKSAGASIPSPPLLSRCRGRTSARSRATRESESAVVPVRLRVVARPAERLQVVVIKSQVGPLGNALDVIDHRGASDLAPLGAHATVGLVQQ